MFRSCLRRSLLSTRCGALWSAAVGARVYSIVSFRHLACQSRHHECPSNWICFPGGRRNRYVGVHDPTFEMAGTSVNARVSGCRIRRQSYPLFLFPWRGAVPHGGVDNDARILCAHSTHSLPVTDNRRRCRHAASFRSRPGRGTCSDAKLKLKSPFPSPSRGQISRCTSESNSGE